MGTIIKGATVLDVKGLKSVQNATVYIEGSQIRKIGPEPAAADLQGHTVIDATGKYLMPGIVNLHQHYLYKRTFGALWNQFQLPIPVLTVRALKNALSELRQGITTTRELGSVHQIDYSLKYLFQEKYVIGPRIFIAGQPLAITGSHAGTLAQAVDGPDEFRRWTRERVQYVDWVKTFASFDPVEQPDGEWARPEASKEEIAAICEEAHLAGKRVAAHSVGTRAIRNAVEGGVDTVEHGCYLNKELAREMKARGTALVPTLTAFTETCNPLYARGKKWIESHEKLIKPNHDGLNAALEAGVKVGMGLDSLGDLYLEAKLMQQVTGLSPLEILQVFTLNGAEILGVANEIGSIEEGKIADLVILDRNPVSDLGNLDSVYMVVKDGEALRPSEITLNSRYESAEYHSMIPELLKKF